MKAKPDKSKTARIAKFVNDSKDPIDEKILTIVSVRKEISIQDLATEIDLHPSNISRRITLLQNEGLVIKYKRSKNNKAFVKWVGGVPAIESELLNSTNSHVAASLLAESYDSMITGAFSVFVLLFEENYWQILMNLKEGLTDTELHKNVGDTINLDSVRRILVTCEAHNLIKINTIRDSAGKDIIKLFEPLYRIESVNKDYIEYMTLLRGLASAIQYKMSTQKTAGYSHLYESLLNRDIQSFVNLKDRVMSKTVGKESELMNKLLVNYDYAPDLDRIYRDEKWRLDIKEFKYLKLGGNDRIIISDRFNII
jgi:DNA-binding Lrp family transcriptional regulator